MAANLLQCMSHTSANRKSFYQSCLYKKSTVSSGREPLTFIPQSSILSTEPSGHEEISVLRINKFLKFLDKHFLMAWALYQRKKSISKFPSRMFHCYTCSVGYDHSCLGITCEDLCSTL